MSWIAMMPLSAVALCPQTDIDSRAEEVSKILQIMRAIRDNTHSQPLRSEYNKVCDRLDILHSKIIESR